MLALPSHNARAEFPTQHGVACLLLRGAAAFYLQARFRVALVINVVRRIGEHKVGGVAASQLRNIAFVRGVANEQPMVAKNP